VAQFFVLEASKPVMPRAGGVPQLKYFRVKFGLPDDAACTFERVKNKPQFVAAAVEWYISHGKESLERLKKIEAMLANGVGADVASRVEPVQKDEIDDAFEDFVV